MLKAAMMTRTAATIKLRANVCGFALIIDVIYLILDEQGMNRVPTVCEWPAHDYYQLLNKEIKPGLILLWHLPWSVEKPVANQRHRFGFFRPFRPVIMAVETGCPNGRVNFFTAPNL